ncbi:MAG: hypothetical protein LBR17_04155 [Bacteroidales bacterium]|jgi:hypothetical protein|nr:hypothetical protein [Bacteroidales bacterium]
MNKRILSILLLGVLSLGFVACSSEEDESLNNNNRSYSKNGTANSLYERKYPQYEDITMSSSDLESSIEHFDEIMNSTTATLSDMNIKEALLIMEAYLNYGVIDKINAEATTANGVLRTFSMEVPLTNGLVNGNELKERYFNFVVDLISAMRGTIMPLSDMYVKDISETSITFAVDINPLPYDGGDENTRYYFPSFYKVNECSQINIPAEVVSNWTEWLNNGNCFEYNVYRYSIKPITTTVVVNEFPTYYTGVQYYGNPSTSTPIVNVLERDAYHTDYVPSTTIVSFNAEEIKTILIPAMLQNLQDIMTDFSVPADKVLADYIPAIRFLNSYQYNRSYYLYCAYLVVATPHTDPILANFTRAINFN